MFEHTHLNHYHYTYNGIPWGDRHRQFDKLEIHFGRCERQHWGWREECIQAARLIHRKLLPGQKIRLCFSGGIDSEVMVQAFMFAEIPFECIIFRLGKNQNQHDIDFATAFCKRFGIAYEIVDIDILGFLNKKQHYEYCEAYQVKELAIMILMNGMDTINRKDYVYLMGGELYLVKKYDLASYYDSEDSNRYRYAWKHFVRENNDLSLFKFSQKRNFNLISEFFSYTPEIMYSYLTDPWVLKLTNNEVRYKFSLLSSKPYVYSKYFLLEPRPKYHGYEEIIELNHKVTDDLQCFGHDVENYVETKYSDLIEILKPND